MTTPDAGRISTTLTDGILERGEERGRGRVSVETIYAFVHRPAQKGEKLWKLLPRGRARRGRRRARQPRATIAERRSIHDRPESVEGRGTGRATS
jgi:IS30 family transposase